jgi:hypothetical protein
VERKSLRKKDGTMAQPNINIPDELPPAEWVVDKVVEFINSPQPMLGGHNLRDLFPDNFDPHRAWVTGSRVWLPAIKGETAPPNKDIDIIFADAGGAEKFTNRVYEVIGKDSGYSLHQLTTNVFGGKKLVESMTGTQILDAWDLETGISIAEHVSGFQYAHERVAVCVGAKPGGEFWHLTRIVKPFKYGDRPHERKARKSEPTYVRYGS